MYHYFHFLHMLLKFEIGVLELIINIQCGELTVAFCNAVTIGNNLSSGDGKKITLLNSHFCKTVYSLHELIKWC